MQIDGAVVAITGASGGMGEASARYLAERGAKVVLGARNDERLHDVVEQITASGGAATHLTVDVRRRDDVRSLARHAVATFGRLDVFVANAGAMPIGPVDELALDDWETMVDVNVKGVLWSIAAALPIFRKQGSGHFIAVASTAARKDRAEHGGIFRHEGRRRGNLRRPAARACWRLARHHPDAWVHGYRLCGPHPG